MIDLCLPNLSQVWRRRTTWILKRGTYTQWLAYLGETCVPHIRQFSDPSPTGFYALSPTGCNFRSLRARLCDHIYSPVPVAPLGQAASEQPLHSAATYSSFPALSLTTPKSPFVSLFPDQSWWSPVGPAFPNLCWQQHSVFSNSSVSDFPYFFFFKHVKNRTYFFVYR